MYDLSSLKCAFKTGEKCKRKLNNNKKRAIQITLHILPHVYHNLKKNLNRHGCQDIEPIPPEFRYRFPLWTVGYLDARLSSGQQKPSAENTTRALKFSNCSTILSTPDSKITS
jgi:hypothetical protein